MAIPLDGLRQEDVIKMLEEKLLKENSYNLFYQQTPNETTLHYNDIKEYIKQMERKNEYSVDKYHYERYRTLEYELRDEIERLYEQVHSLRAIQQHEEELREEHPGLKELWDQYQAMLRLVDVGTETI